MPRGSTEITARTAAIGPVEVTGRREVQGGFRVAKSLSPPGLALPTAKSSDTEPAFRAATWRPLSVVAPARLNFCSQKKLLLAAGAAKTR